MRVCIDIEANGLELKDITKIWLIVCKDIDSGEYYRFREPSESQEEKDRFTIFVGQVHLWIGHNIAGYDIPVINSILGIDLASSNLCDTLIISKMADYSRTGHAIEDYGVEFNLEKGKFDDWSKYSPEMEEYCIRDVEISHLVYNKYLKFINNSEYKLAIDTEQAFQRIVNSLHNNGFYFNSGQARKLLAKVEEELGVLDKAILEQFPARLKLVREVTPRGTKHGTIARNSIPKVLGDDLTPYSIDASFCLCTWSEFNPASPKQIIDILTEAGWNPVDKTQTAIETEREINKLKYNRNRNEALDKLLEELYIKYNKQQKYGWKVNETNLATLPADAPLPARSLARRILYESRRRTLTEWLSLVGDDQRIHGKFYAIGAWTHRMAHQAPNTANIPNEYDTAGKLKLLGGDMRKLWIAPKNKLLVGVDAEGIQLRIFAHYINDPEFTEALVNGKKEDKSDPHSLNQRILGNVCKSRAAAKRFIYALLLGAGINKLAEVLGTDQREAQSSLDRLLERYTGFALLKQSIIPTDAKRGWFIGIDGRAVRIPGETVGQRKHLAMSGYLQNGEAVVMKHATLLWDKQLREAGIEFKLVNFVHDEWQTECENNMDTALKIARTQADALRIVGENLGLLCPLAGSYWNEDLKDYTIGTTWKVTH